MQMPIHPESLTNWVKTQFLMNRDLSSLTVRDCVVSNFRGAQEIIFTDAPVYGGSLILSCYGPKSKYFHQPNLSDLSDPIRKLTRMQTKETVKAFQLLIDKETQVYFAQALLFKQHMNTVLENALEVTVISADRTHLTLLAWYQDKTLVKPSTHTYDLDQLVRKEQALKPKSYNNQDSARYADKVSEGFLSLLKSEFPNRRTLSPHSPLMFASRILRISQPCAEGELEVTFEDNTLKIRYPKEKAALFFNLVHHIPSDLQGNYDTLKAYENLYEAITQKPKHDHDRLWHFLRLPTRFNDKPSKRALAYEVKPDMAVFYHRMGSHYLAITLHY